MDLESFNHYIVFYTTVNLENTLQHLIGFNVKPDINDTYDALIEFQTEVLPKLEIEEPVFMIYMNAQGVRDIFGF